MHKAPPAVLILRAFVGYRESLKLPDPELQMVRLAEMTAVVSSHPHGQAIVKAIELSIDHFPKILLFVAFTALCVAKAFL